MGGAAASKAGKDRVENSSREWVQRVSGRGEVAAMIFEGKRVVIVNNSHIEKLLFLAHSIIHLIIAK